MKDFFTKILNRLDFATMVGLFVGYCLIFSIVLAMFNALDKEHEIQERKIQHYQQEQARTQFLQTHYPNMKQNE